MTRSSSQSHRRAVAVESFKTAGDALGPIVPGCSIFAVTRGQFSMIDAVLHVLDQAGEPCFVSLWTWTIADYEIARFAELRSDGRIRDGRLVIDGGARLKNAPLIAAWRDAYGPDSVRYVRNHAKIATVESSRLRVLLRGSMNLNHNPRFEQLDVTEGGPDFDLVRRLELELPVLRDDASDPEIFAASKVAQAFDQATLAPFVGLKTFRK